MKIAIQLVIILLFALGAIALLANLMRELQERAESLAGLEEELPERTRALREARSIGGFFLQRFRIPLAALGVEKIATVDMDTAGKSQQGIRHRMQGIDRQCGRVFFKQCIDRPILFRDKILNLAFSFYYQAKGD